MSKTVTIQKKNPTHGRFTDASWYHPELEMTLGGAGGIGSWLAIFLSRVGYTIYLYEMDTIEEHNIGGQAYFKNQIGKTKAEAVSDIVGLMCDELRITTIGKFEEDSPVTPITFSAFDNMAARKIMFEQWKLIAKDNPEALFIDGRMTAETGIIYCVTPDRIEAYEKELFDDSEVADDPCSYKATSHNGAVLAAYMLQNLLNIIGNKNLNLEVYNSPFKFAYELPMFTTTSYNNETV
jgi:molybdopterin/thiamine biosynthesis adenylyltransferase